MQSTTLRFFPFPLTLSPWDCLLQANIPYAKAFEYPPIDSKRINLQFDPVELEISQVIHQQATEITNLTLTPQKVLAACYCLFKSAPSSYSTTFINWICCNQRYFKLRVSQTHRHCQRARTLLTPITTRFSFFLVRLVGSSVLRVKPLDQNSGFPFHSDSRFRHYRLQSNPGFPFHSDSRFRQF